MLRRHPFSVALAAAISTIAACATGGQRPRLSAAPESVSAVLVASPDSVIAHLDARIRSLGMAVVRSAPREGYLETAWIDVHSRATEAAPFTRLDSIVKFRFFADPVQGRTRLLAEAMRRIAWDPSLPPRELERMVPSDHPARALLDSMLVAVKPDSVPRPPLGPDNSGRGQRQTTTDRDR